MLRLLMKIAAGAIALIIGIAMAYLSVQGEADAATTLEVRKIAS